MIGAIAGDIIGSTFEFCSTKRTDFELFGTHSKFTDDTILTVAIADAILTSRDYAKVMQEYGKRYPLAGYGDMFNKWLYSDNPKPYNSFGNGSAMRVSPVGFAFDTASKVLEEAKKSAEVTHNHPEGIKGAQAVAMAVFLSRNGKDKTYIKESIEDSFSYNISRTVEDIESSCDFDETCGGTVPPAIIAFLESKDYEDAVRKAVSVGGDSDTIACIAGGIAQAYYKKVPDYIVSESRKRLTPELLKIVDLFHVKYHCYPN